MSMLEVALWLMVVLSWLGIIVIFGLVAATLAVVVGVIGGACWRMVRGDEEGRETR